MDLKAYLELVANVVPSGIEGDEDGKVYISKFDNSYITRVGMEEDVKFLADNDITEELTNGVGFSPNQHMWYGWSHRAMGRFTIGSTCKKGDCHYRAANVEDMLEQARESWTDDFHTNVNARVAMPGKIHVSWEYTADTPNPDLQGKVSGVDWAYDPDNFGRGEWVAKTMEDAKQMAIDFNEGVS